MSEIFVDPNNSLTSGRTPGANLVTGGQQGHQKNPSAPAWIVNENYVKNKLIAVLLDAPDGFQYMADGDYRIAFLKALVELHPTSITGLNSSLAVEFAETPLSNAGEQHETPSNVTRERSQVAFSWPEKIGKVITSFHEQWITQLLLDPELDHPGIIASDAYIAAGSPEITPTFRSMAMLFIEPSNNLRNVTDAWLVTNMMPKGVTNEGSRVAQAALELDQKEIAYTGITQTGKGVVQLAKTYLDSLNRKGYAPLDLPAGISGVSADVADEATETGYAKNAADAAASIGS